MAHIHYCTTPGVLSGPPILSLFPVNVRALGPVPEDEQLAGPHDIKGPINAANLNSPNLQPYTYANLTQDAAAGLL